ncbi:hypothetical protein JCM15060_24600 [Halanaerobaculum tunisiense]
MSTWGMQVALDKKRDNESVHVELLGVIMVGMAIIVFVIDQRSL